MSTDARKAKPRDPEPCPVCRYHPKKSNRQAGSNEVWECSHVECPNRRIITAAPRETGHYQGHDY